MRKRLFPSFSHLISQLRGGYVLEDDSNTYYLFGCSKAGIDFTLDMYDQDKKCDRAFLMSVLEKAENEGRVCWNSEDKINKIQFIKNLGFSVRIHHTGYESISEIDVMLGHNLPQMEKLIVERHPDIEFMW